VHRLPENNLPERAQGKRRLFSRLGGDRSQRVIRRKGREEVIAYGMRGATSIDGSLSVLASTD